MTRDELTSRQEVD